MKDKLFNLFQATGELSLESIILNIAVSALIGVFIYVSYMITHKGTIYSKKFNASLVVMTVRYGRCAVHRAFPYRDQGQPRHAVHLLDGHRRYLLRRRRLSCRRHRQRHHLRRPADIRTDQEDNRMLVIIRAARSRQATIQAHMFALFKRKAILRVRNTDEESVAAWRDIVCPNYYSFNLGKVHYVVLDDIVYLNIAYPGETYSEGVAGSRNYRGAITNEQIQWLRKDLALVDHATPVVVCLHIPAWSITSNFNYSARLDNTYTLCSILNDYDEVHIVSGHNHCNYTAEPAAYPHITEHNIAATCGSLWQSAVITGHHICQDGSPAGYMRWTINGTRLQWAFKPIHEGERQMRVYDMNTVRDFYRTNATIKAILNEYPSRVNYGNIADNTLMVNVYAFAPGWQVTICEGDSILPSQRVYTEDPYHTLAYDVPRYATAGYYSTYYITTNSTHLFKAQAATATKPVTVRVVDTFGNVYLHRIARPHHYNLDMEGKETLLVPGDVNGDGEINIADINAVVALLIGTSSQSFPLLLADVNADGEVNIADVNKIIDSILKN